MTAPARVSGAFLLLPFQVSVLGFTGPAVGPTNLIYNVFASPGGIIRYLREGWILWELALIVVTGSLPGVLAGAMLRVTLFASPDAFRTFVGLVLLYLGGRLLWEIARELRSEEEATGPARLHVGAVKSSIHRVECEFAGAIHAFAPAPVLLLSFAVGVVGGVYSIGAVATSFPFWLPPSGCLYAPLLGRRWSARS